MIFYNHINIHNTYVYSNTNIEMIYSIVKSFIMMYILLIFQKKNEKKNDRIYPSKNIRIKYFSTSSLDDEF